MQVVERVEEPVLRDPALLFDEDAVHHGDLPRGAAERQGRHAQPDPECLCDRHATRRRPGELGVRDDLVQAFSLLGDLGRTVGPSGV
jgi:hypothetical protein